MARWIAPVVKFFSRRPRVPAKRPRWPRKPQRSRGFRVAQKAGLAVRWASGTNCGMPSRAALDFTRINTLIRQFAVDRDWEQFHSPKNLSMAVAGEAGELLEIFQWLSEDQSREIMLDSRKAQAVREEVADVMILLLRLTDVLSIDLRAATLEKLEKNGEKYPVALSKGSARKYDELHE
jgi:NTP pyrophosphatase (non-canonical NTP hydrolase)